MTALDIAEKSAVKRVVTYIETAKNRYLPALFIDNLTALAFPLANVGM